MCVHVWDSFKKQTNSWPEIESVRVWYKIDWFHQVFAILHTAPARVFNSVRHFLRWLPYRGTDESQSRYKIRNLRHSSREVKSTSISILIRWRRQKLFPFRRNFTAFCSSFVGRFKLFLDAQTSLDCRVVVDYNNYYMPDLIYCITDLLMVTKFLPFYVAFLLKWTNHAAAFRTF